MSTVTLEAGAVIEACERMREGRAASRRALSEEIERFLSPPEYWLSAPAFFSALCEHDKNESKIDSIKHLAMVGRDHGCDVTLSREDCDLLGRSLLNPYEPKIEDFY